MLAGDKAALTAFYMTSPPARAKTPQGETLDPAEEPAFWSSLKPAGLDHLEHTSSRGENAAARRDVAGPANGSGTQDQRGRKFRHHLRLSSLGAKAGRMENRRDAAGRSRGQSKPAACPNRPSRIRSSIRRRKKRKRKFPRRSPRPPRTTSASSWCSAETGATTATCWTRRFAPKSSLRS